VVDPCGGSIGSHVTGRGPRVRACATGSCSFLFSFFFFSFFIRPSGDGPYYVIWVWRAAGCGRPHRFPHNDFSSVYQIFTKFDHMIPLRKGKNSIYVRVIRSKFKVTITNIIFDNRVVSAR
jgi:hypothetical protein